jgi:hypothetical protein
MWFHLLFIILKSLQAGVAPFSLRCLLAVSQLHANDFILASHASVVKKFASHCLNLLSRLVGMPPVLDWSCT